MERLQPLALERANHFVKEYELKLVEESMYSRGIYDILDYFNISIAYSDMGLFETKRDGYRKVYEGVEVFVLREGMSKELELFVLSYLLGSKYIIDREQYVITEDLDYISKNLKEVEVKDGLSTFTYLAIELLLQEYLIFDFVDVEESFKLKEEDEGLYQKLLDRESDRLEVPKFVLDYKIEKAYNDFKVDW